MLEIVFIYSFLNVLYKSFCLCGIIKMWFSVILLYYLNDFERLVDKDWDKNLKSVMYKC